MLEDNLKTLFTLEAEADQPPSHISVPDDWTGHPRRPRSSR